MAPYAQTATHLFAIAMLGLHAVLLTVVLFRVLRGRWLPTSLLEHVRSRGLVYAALLPVMAFGLSLWYSEVVGLPVCALCWFGRTMMYPLAVILPIAAWRNDHTVWRYTLPLAIIGALITGYQHLLQVGFVTGSLCSVLKDAGDCAARYVFEFNYITLPLFGVTIFLTTALLVWIARDGSTGVSR